jgi:GDP-L-fucose synthase
MTSTSSLVASAWIIPKVAVAVPPGTRCHSCSKVTATESAPVPFMHQIVAHGTAGNVTATSMSAMSFWADKRVLVTGGKGFLGSAVVRRLESSGAKEVVSLGSEDYDLMRQVDVESMFEDHRPDIVFNLAARVGGIGANMARPAELYLSNLLIGTYVLEEARVRKTPKTILVGTICAYPKFTPVPFKEESLWDGYPEETNAPYGIAKKALLVHSQANRSQYGQSSIYLLPVNLYGPGDKFNPAVSHVIPALIKKCVEAKERGEREIVAWGSGTATREFLYVEDAAEGLVLAAERYDGAEPVNLGSGREISIRELTELIVELTGFEGSLRWDTSKPDGQPRRRLDTSRAEASFGFTASTPLREGLAATISWYISHRTEAERATD